MLKSLIHLFSVLILATSSALMMGCESPVILRVENQTDMSITIYLKGLRCFDVPPHKTMIRETNQQALTPTYFVEGMNQSGQIIYSRYFDLYKSRDPKKIRHTFNVVITPSEDKPYLPLTIENASEYPIWVFIEKTQIGLIEPGITVTRRPLPSDSNSYEIGIGAIMTSSSNLTKITFSKMIMRKVFTQNELQQINWHLVIRYPDSLSP